MGAHFSRKSRKSNIVKKTEETRTFILALFDYNAAKPDELSFKSGDILVLNQEQNRESESVWWYAERPHPIYYNIQEKGFVPKQFFQITDRILQKLDTVGKLLKGKRVPDVPTNETNNQQSEDARNEESTDLQKRDDNTESSSSLTSSFNISPVPLNFTISSEESISLTDETVICACNDYDAENEDELSFKKGELLKLNQEKEYEQFWWYAERSHPMYYNIQHKGFVPKTCFKVTNRKSQGVIVPRRDRHEDTRLLKEKVLPGIPANEENYDSSTGAIKQSSLKEPKEDDGLVLIGGNIYFYPMKTIGHGSKAVVFEGRYGLSKTKKIAVKAITCSNEKEAKGIESEIKLIYKEIKTLETLIEPSRHSNIVDFIDSHIDIKRAYIALELGDGTLCDYVQHMNASWRESLKPIEVIRGVSDGIRYIHEKNVVHRDMKPENVLIVGRNYGNLRAVISDFGTAKATTGSMFSLTGRTGSMGFIAPELWSAMSSQSIQQINKKSDIYSTGIVFYYVISLGNHPFGQDLAAQERIQSGCSPVLDLIDTTRNSFAKKSLVTNMLKTDLVERPTAVDICSHPALWTDEKILRYFSEKSDEVEDIIKAFPSKNAILEDSSLIPNGNWMNNLPVNTRTYLRNYRVNKNSSKLYDGKESSVRSLLRAVRNTNSHYKQFPIFAHVELGDYPGDHVDMWLNVCPKLLMHVLKMLGPP